MLNLVKGKAKCIGFVLLSGLWTKTVTLAISIQGTDYNSSQNSKESLCHHTKYTTCKVVIHTRREEKISNGYHCPWMAPLVSLAKYILNDQLPSAQARSFMTLCTGQLQPWTCLEPVLTHPHLSTAMSVICYLLQTLSTLLAQSKVVDERKEIMNNGLLLCFFWAGQMMVETVANRLSSNLSMPRYICSIHSGIHRIIFPMLTPVQ